MLLLAAVYKCFYIGFPFASIYTKDGQYRVDFDRIVYLDMLPISCVGVPCRGATGWVRLVNNENQKLHEYFTRDLDGLFENVKVRADSVSFVGEGPVWELGK